ncbi:MAG: serine/threonine-protein kinase, partial [Planctomycetota bacterium]|nr:serine/threonine-protein kinase [Planctomycetota bacterium]
MAEPPANSGNEGQPRPDDVSTVRDSRIMVQGEQNDPLIGTTVGQYTIKRVIGSGGMGTVYEALQQSPRRTVALKMMKPGVVSRNALRRFEYEAQTLGRLRHDNIAQIYEAGTHDDGSGARPFFAMEYIAGAKPLTTYAADKKLGTRERLELFSKVCDAVQHGHQKGIIHRDLKPPNILVTSSGVPKIIDFGVARSTDSDMAVTTLQTDVGALIGTLQYMSPEQCAADPNDIDTRSDVYALGVILFELLCDSLPYDLTRVAIAEAARIVQQEEPTKPSTVDKRLRGDVETIALKALEKDRDRRYQSATALEDDINRYLAGDPITAKAPSAIDYLKRFARKHKAAAISIAAIFVVLVGAVIAISIFAAEAQRQRQESEHLTITLFASEFALEDEVKKAEQAQAEAEQEAQRAITSLNFLSEMLTFDPVEAESLDTGMVKQMLANAELRLDEEASDQPLVEASIRHIIGNSYLGLTMLEEAEPHLARALELRKEYQDTDHGSLRHLPDLLESMYSMGILRKTQGRYAEAEPYY